MENFERVAVEILSYIRDTKRLMNNVLLQRGKEARFILCGSSGSGKTRAIEEANKKLSENEQIAESQLMVFIQDPSKALNIFNDRNIKYLDSVHIGFNVVRKDLAKKLEVHGIKVFWV